MNLEDFYLLAVLRLPYANGVPTIPLGCKTWEKYRLEFQDIRNLSFVRSFMELKNRLYRLEFFSLDDTRAYQLVRNDKDRYLDIFLWQHNKI